MNNPRHSGASRNPVTDNLDLWTSALLTKSTTGRGGNGKREAYGIKKLRELILELAVRGKLVSQDTNDEPASVLLGKIAKEKARLIKDGRLGKEKPLPEVLGEDEYFSLPHGWVWTRLGEVTNYGFTDKADPEDVDEDTWVLDLEDIEKVTSRLLTKNRFSDKPFLSSKNRFSSGDVIYGKLRPYLDKVLVADEDGVCTTEMVPVRGYYGISPFYLRLVMKAPHFIKYADDSTHGMNLPRLGTDKARMALFPLVPLAEQHRIVAKVDELMALCDQLEQQQTHSLESHQTLVETLLGTLTSAASHQELTESWTRIADHFDTLFTTEHSIDQLKQTILQLAVMGKLVPQDPNDEPIKVTIASIDPLPRPARYAKRSPELIQGLCGLSVNNPKTSLPSGWSWVSLVEVARLESGHTPSRNRPEWWDGDIPWLGLVDARIHNNGFIYDTIQKTNEAGLENSAARLLPVGTVCFSRTASVGYVVVMGLPMATSQDFVNWIPTPAITSNWLKLVLIAERPAINRFSKGAVHQTIYYPAWLSMHIALPPVAEQHRIIAKVDELVALCDTLKSRIKDAQVTQIHLADATVEQAVA